MPDNERKIKYGYQYTLLENIFLTKWGQKWGHCKYTHLQPL